MKCRSAAVVGLAPGLRAAGAPGQWAPAGAWLVRVLPAGAEALRRQAGTQAGRGTGRDSQAPDDASTGGAPSRSGSATVTSMAAGIGAGCGHGA
jgi:hypothetical protein